VSDGEPCALSVTYTKGGRDGGDRLLTRLFDADEKLIFREYETPEPDDYPIRHALRLPPQRGVHQLRIIAGANNALVQVECERPLPFGVCGQLGTLYSWDEALAEAWVYVPPKATVMELKDGPVTVEDAAGKTLAELPEPKGAASAPVTSHDVLLRLRFPEPGNWSLQMRGFPFIVCPTQEAARAVHASIEELPDGTVVHHKFQVEIAKLLPSLLAPDKIGRADKLIVPLLSREAEWAADALRNQNLLGSYGFMEHVGWSLRMQDVDPSSSTSGAITLQKGRRWDDYGGGGSLTGGSLATGLARAATLEAPFNPYFGKRELLYRAAACALRDLMLVDEDESFKSGGSGDMNPYPTSSLYFPLGHTHSEPFAIAAPLMPEEVRTLWAQALERPVDRMLPVGLVSCRNQSSHALTVLWHYYTGSGDERFRDAANKFGDRFAAGMTAGCFDMESCGPDATYQGMTDWHKGYFYRLSGHPGILESIRSTYRFFNHTVAPEPDGTVLGASNFSHRTSGSFAVQQWGGAKGTCDDVLPEVGIWAKARTDEARARAAETIHKRLAAPFTDQDYATEGGRARGRYASQITAPRYLYYTDDPLPGTWPAAAEQPFIRNFGGEMVAVKRPAYYCVVYVGKPAPSEFYIKDRAKFRTPLPGGAESNGGAVESKPVTPYLGGGLSMFWTPEYGSGVLAMNWSPLTHHGIVVRMPDATRWWEEYFSTEFALDEDAGALVVTGAIEEQPLSYERRYVFGDDALSVEVTVTAGEDFRCAGMVENIPLALGEVKARGAIVDAPARGTSFSVRDDAGAGFECVFDAERQFRAVEAGLRYRNGQVAGRVEVSLPESLGKGQETTLRYQLRPL
ncbi:MAG: hypothetical protein ACE5JM_03645, partial [Armatimonadota bacterium]